MDNDNKNAIRKSKGKTFLGYNSTELLVFVIATIILGYFSIGPFRKLGQPTLPLPSPLLERLLDTPKDSTTAVRWFFKAAEQGDAEAQYILGLCYAYGGGVPQDDEEAIKWIRKAAAQWHEKASNLLREIEADQNTPTESDDAPSALEPQ